MSETIDYTVGELSGEYIVISQKTVRIQKLYLIMRQVRNSNRRLHGLGLYMIEDIVKEYDGVVEWKDAGEMFESNLMLKLR